MAGMAVGAGGGLDERLLGGGVLGIGGGRRFGASRRRLAENTLRPVRTLLPRRVALLKSALVAALIATAAGILWLPGTDGSPSPASFAGTPAPALSSGTAAQALPAAPAPSAASAAEPPAWAGTTAALPAGTVGVPVPIVEPAALAVVRAGARVDLMLVPAPFDGAPPTPTMLASAALVLQVVAPDALDGVGALYLALTPEQAQRVVVAPPDARFAVVIRS